MADPLGFLAAARHVHGDLFLMPTDRPIFSRAADLSGVVYASGAAHQRAVLRDIDSFGMPLSAARHLNLDPRLVNLNRGLHSLPLEDHAVQKSLLTAILHARHTEGLEHAVWRALEDLEPSWAAGAEFGLLSRLREMMLAISTRVLFGAEYEEYGGLASLLQTYFLLRREASSPAAGSDDRTQDDLEWVGRTLDAELRAYVRRCRHEDTPRSGILAKVARLEAAPGGRLSEDEVVGHMNVFFISSTEPMAVALAWTLLILTQLPRLRSALRDELRTLVGGGDPGSHDVERSALLHGVIHESLRLLPPNAFMVRVTRKPVLLGGFQLPARCEVILCPFLSHRDADAFDRPGTFSPERWETLQPSRFQYFPFGAGGHACVGQSLAVRMMKLTLAFLLSKYDVVLAGDQQIGWRLHIQFMPRPDPVAILSAANDQNPNPSGKLLGPIGTLLQLG